MFCTDCPNICRLFNEKLLVDVWVNFIFFYLKMEKFWNFSPTITWFTILFKISEKSTMTPSFVSLIYDIHKIFNLFFPKTNYIHLIRWEPINFKYETFQNILRQRCLFNWFYCIDWKFKKISTKDIKNIWVFFIILLIIYFDTKIQFHCCTKKLFQVPKKKTEIETQLTYSKKRLKLLL